MAPVRPRIAIVPPRRHLLLFSPLRCPVTCIGIWEEWPTRFSFLCRLIRFLRPTYPSNSKDVGVGGGRGRSTPVQPRRARAERTSGSCPSCMHAARRCACMQTAMWTEAEQFFFFFFFKKNKHIGSVHLGERQGQVTLYWLVHFLAQHCR